MLAIKFQDETLQRQYDRILNMLSGPDAQKNIIALLDTLDWFKSIEGPQSARAKEAIEALLLPRLRPGLRQWYQDCGNNLNPGALEFREQLGLLAGEKFGPKTDH